VKEVRGKEFHVCQASRRSNENGAMKNITLIMSLLTNFFLFLLDLPDHIIFIKAAHSLKLNSSHNHYRLHLK
jgi:hypothetical protein